MALRTLKRTVATALNALIWLWRTKELFVSPIAALRFRDLNSEPNYLATIRYSGGRFVCRKQDWFGIEEIFLDKEYLPVISCLGAAQSPVIVDLGANIGGFALFIFSHYRDAHVLSVEPAPDTFEILSENRRLNAARKWDVLEVAVWSENGSVNLDRRCASTGHRVFVGGEGELVHARPLGEILSSIGISEIDLLKIDIEGAEQMVLPTCEAILENTKVLVIEVHTDRINPSSVYELLGRVFRHCWQLRGRSAQKPVFILAHTDLPALGAMGAFPTKLRSISN